MHNNNSNKISKVSLLALSSAIALLVGCQQAPVSTPIASACLSADTTLQAIQGDAMQSPLLGQKVTINAVVSASWQGSDALGGFFVTSATGDAGLFVQADTPAVTRGDQVSVTGTVSEAQQLTQLSNISALHRCGEAVVPEPTELTLPVADLAAFEALEGRLVRLPQTLVVNGTYLLGRHGSFDVAAERLYIPTQVVAPGPQAQQLKASYALQRLVIDDNQAPNPAQVPYPTPALSAENTLRSGDQVAQIEGILSEYNGSYRIQPTQALQFIQQNPRPQPLTRPADVRSLRIATFNVLNYFNGEGDSYQFPTQRGAKTAAAFARQEAKIIAALSALDADIIGLMEVENDGYQTSSAITRLVQQLSEHSGRPWQFVQVTTPTLGSDAISNGLIYRSDRVQPIGEALTIASDSFAYGSRQPLIQRFQPKGTEESLVVAVNHFKSKGSCPRDTTDRNADQGDGQGCWNALRADSARQLIAFLQAQPSIAATSAQVVLGDFNAYAKEEPLQVFAAAGYHNRAEHFEPQGYSYVYDAQAGSLDHLLVSDALHGRVLLQRHWLINADEPPALSYQSAEQHPSWYAPNLYRSSDHDPIIADILF